MRFLTAIGLGLAVGLTVVACSAAAAPAATPPPVSQNLILVADTVQGSANLTDAEKAAGAVCVQKNRFEKNEDVVWRIKVIDPATGQPMDDKALTSVVVKLPDQDLTAKYGDHPKSNPVDHFWATSFDIPATYPTGLLNYSIVATATDGRSGTYSQFGVASAQLTVTDQVRPVISQ